MSPKSAKSRLPAIYDEEDFGFGTVGSSSFAMPPLPSKPAEWRMENFGLMIGAKPRFDPLRSRTIKVIDGLMYAGTDITCLVNVPTIPTNLGLDNLIAKAKKELLALEHDWDDAGASPIDAATFGRASKVLNSMAIVALMRGVNFPLPSVKPTAAGSIDLYWNQVGRTLLINIPAGAAMGTYSGRRGNDSTAGTIDVAAGRLSHLTAWLTE